MQDMLKEEILILKQRTPKDKKEFEPYNTENQYKERIKRLMQENAEKDRKNEEL